MGKSVILGKDRWFPQASIFQIHPPLHDRFKNARVCDLINYETKTWNMNLVADILYESDANLISTIPISQCDNPDKLIWKGTKDGLSTVKSAYHFFNQIKQDSNGQSSSNYIHCEVRRKLWKIKASNASKMLLWRATHDSIPTNLNLFRRKIRESPLCPICLREEESVVHALWLCGSAQDVWGSSSRKLQKTSLMPLHFKELISHLFQVLSEVEVEFFTATIYLIWKRRNSFVFEEKFEGPETILKSAYQNALDFREVNSRLVTHIHRGGQPHQLWTAPPPNTHKINWDAAVDAINCRVGIGVVVRDWNGKVKAVMMAKRKVSPDPFLAESMAAMEAASFGKHLVLQSIILEGDTLNVVKGINGVSEFWNTPGLLIEDTKCMLSFFNSWSVNHIPRLANVVVHSLAKEALKFSEERIVLEISLSCIRNLL